VKKFVRKNIIDWNIDQLEREAKSKTPDASRIARLQGNIDALRKG
jgi:NAD-dependent SIR2 family protein deacetylase